LLKHVFSTILDMLRFHSDIKDHQDAALAVVLNILMHFSNL